MNEKLKKLREKLGALVTDSRTLADKETRTEDEDKRLNEGMDAIDALKNQIEQEERLAGFETEIRKPVNEPIKIDPAEGTEPEIRAGANRAAKRPYASIGEQLLDVQLADRGEREERAVAEERLMEVRVASGMNESIPSEGGFLVQTDFADELLKRTYEVGTLAPRCRDFVISNPSDSVTIVRSNETSRANGYRYGGVNVYWSSEAENVDSKMPKLGEVKLSLEELKGYCIVTDKLLIDAPALTSYINLAFSEEFNYKLDEAILVGTGGGQPAGILNANCTVEVSKENGQDPATIEANNIINMRARMWARSRPNSVWLINQDIEPALHTMGLPVGTGGHSVFMPANGLSGLPYDTLYGRPIIPMEQCKTLGTKGDIIYADFSQYLLARKGGLEAASSIHVRFAYHETAFRFIMRIDGKPWWASALTPANGSNTLSPFVVLETRS